MKSSQATHVTIGPQDSPRRYLRFPLMPSYCTIAFHITSDHSHHSSMLHAALPCTSYSVIREGTPGTGSKTDGARNDRTHRQFVMHMHSTKGTRGRRRVYGNFDLISHGTPVYLMEVLQCEYKDVLTPPIHNLVNLRKHYPSGCLSV